MIVLTDKKTAQAEIQKAFATLKQQLKPLDTFFLFFIGHGSGDDGHYKFNIIGPDYTADDYNKLLATLSVGRIVIVDGNAGQRRGAGEVCRKESRRCHGDAKRPGRQRHRFLRVLPRGLAKSCRG